MLTGLLSLEQGRQEEQSGNGDVARRRRGAGEAWMSVKRPYPDPKAGGAQRRFYASWQERRAFLSDPRLVALRKALQRHDHLNCCF